jgi:hypothetical protein
MDSSGEDNTPLVMWLEKIVEYLLLVHFSGLGLECLVLTLGGSENLLFSLSLFGLHIGCCEKRVAL